MTSPSSPFVTPWVRRLLVANLVVYVLSVTIFTGRWFGGLLAFDPQSAGAHPWTFGAYMFAHPGFLALAVNMLILLMFGPAVERRMGGGAFLRYYLLCGLGAPAVLLAASLFTNRLAPLTGAAGAVFGVALAFALAWPQARIFVFPLPWPVPVKALVGTLAVMDLTPLALDPAGGLAPLAHLGGFVLGFVYLKGERLMERHGPVAVDRENATPVLVAHQPAAEAAETPLDRTTRPTPSRDDVTQEMDRVLDKISQHGMGSLTAAERRFLDDMSRQMRRR